MKRVKKNAILFKLFWYIYKVFPLKVKTTHFPNGFRLNRF